MWERTGGYPSCFLAKEYGVFVVGIDPWSNRESGRWHIEHLRDDAQLWGVSERVLGVRVGVPDTRFAANTFDAVYSTTTLEMIRGIEGEPAYRQCLAEIYRVLKPGGVFGLGELMHLEVEMPVDLAPLVAQGPLAWVDCFATVRETEAARHSLGWGAAPPMEQHLDHDHWAFANEICDIYPSQFNF